MFESKVETEKTAPSEGILDARWSAIDTRDASARFIYGVTSTGIYCRPECASRRPKRANVRFFESARQAEADGFRACLRCAPNQASTPAAEQIKMMCDFIERASFRPSLAEIAACVGLSPSHAQRVFVAAMKLSPKEYYQLQLKQRLDQKLASESSLMGAAHAAGFESKSDLYVKAKEWFGATPKERQAALQRTRLHVSFASSSLGCVLVAESARGVSAVLLGGDRKALMSDLTRRFPGAEIVDDETLPSPYREGVLSVIEGNTQETSHLAFDLLGTPFQVQVWRALCTIPWGATLSYSELAARLGRPRSTRAVASACAKNPIAILVPCHRILRADGELGGYRWGLENKSLLLKRETGTDLATFRASRTPKTGESTLATQLGRGVFEGSSRHLPISQRTSSKP